MSVKVRILYTVVGICLLATVPTLSCHAESIPHEDLPDSVLVNTLLRIIVVQDDMGRANDFIRTLGVDPESPTGEELLQLAKAVEQSYPSSELPPEESEQRARLDARLYMAGEGTARWLEAIGARGEDPGSVLKAVLHSQSWSMSSSQLEDLGDLGRGRSASTSGSESLAEMHERLDREFRRGIESQLGEVPNYLERKRGN